MIVICGNKCKMIIFPGVFFYIFKILIFWVFRKIKEKKMAQNDKIFGLCSLYLMSHSSCDLDLWCTCVRG